MLPIEYKDLSKNPNSISFSGRHSVGTMLSPEEVSFPPYAVGPDITIGAFCSFAQGSALICNSDHHPNKVTTYSMSYVLGWGQYGLTQDGPKDPYIHIGNDVWMGYNSVVLQCVTVGDGAVIGSGAVVTKDVEPYTIVTGVPARPLRKRFTEEQIAALLEIKWWDWPDDIIEENADLLLSSHIDMFIKQARLLKEQGRVE